MTPFEREFHSKLSWFYLTGRKNWSFGYSWFHWFTSEHCALGKVFKQIWVHRECAITSWPWQQLAADESNNLAGLV
jgi:hypothetical protein